MTARLTVYTKPGCGGCIGTKRTLEKAGVDFEEKDVRDPAHMTEAKATGFLGAPIVVADPALGLDVSEWVGFRPDYLQEVIDKLEGKDADIRG